jgi:hypothetical protein
MFFSGDTCIVPDRIRMMTDLGVLRPGITITITITVTITITIITITVTITIIITITIITIRSP